MAESDNRGLSLSSAGSTRILLFLVLALIVYGSLYPAELRPSPAGPAGAFRILLHAWPSRITARLLVDMEVNILLYVPFGWAAFLTLSGRSRLVRITLPILLSAALSASMEYLQAFLLFRVTSLLDLAANTLGGMLGVAAGFLINVDMPFGLWSRHRKRLAAETSVLLLIACWVSVHLFPFFPSIGFFRLGEKLRHLSSWRWNSAPAELFLATAEWSAAYYLVSRLSGPEAAVRWALVLSLLLPAQLFIIHQTLTAAGLLGGLAALLLWTVWLRRAQNQTLILAGILLLGILISGLAPFRFLPAPGLFSWLPFGSAFYTGAWEPAGISLLHKSFRYGACIWLLKQSGIGLVPGAAFVAALLAAVEAVQVYLPTRTPESTDPLLALLLAVIFRLLSSGKKKTSDPA